MEDSDGGALVHTVTIQAPKKSEMETFIGEDGEEYFVVGSIALSDLPREFAEALEQTLPSLPKKTTRRKTKNGGEKS